jgi:hypothetical protein
MKLVEFYGWRIALVLEFSWQRTRWLNALGVPIVIQNHFVETTHVGLKCAPTLLSPQKTKRVVLLSQTCGQVTKRLL